MPHTSYKKKQARSRRQEVVGEDGWTRVTSQKSLAVTAVAPNSTAGWVAQIEDAPDGVTQADVLARYADIEKRWKASESWKVTENTLKTRVLSSSARVDNCVLFGSGTFTGLRQGWINRAHVAMYQLAAFKAVVDLIGIVPEHCTGLRPSAYAQEPIYNAQDRVLLRTLVIQVADDPDAFYLLTNHSFAFCPGAEQHVVLQTLKRDPSIYLGGTLDSYVGSLDYLQSNVIDVGYEVEGTGHATKDREDPQKLLLYKIEALKEEASNDSGRRLDKGWIRNDRSQHEPDVQIIKRFLQNTEVTKIPDLDAQDFPIHDDCLYWRVESAESLSVHE